MDTKHKMIITKNGGVLIKIYTIKNILSKTKYSLYKELKKSDENYIKGIPTSVMMQFNMLSKMQDKKKPKKKYQLTEHAKDRFDTRFNPYGYSQSEILNDIKHSISRRRAKGGRVLVKGKIAKYILSTEGHIITMIPYD